MQSDRQATINVTNRTIARVILWVLVAVVGYHFIGRVTHVLTLIFVSFFLAMAINPIVSWMSNRFKIKGRATATAAAYLTVVAIIAILIALIVPPLVRQTRDFINSVPQTVENFQAQDTSLSRVARKYHLDTKLTQAARDFTSNHGNFGTTILDTGKRVAGAVVSLVAIIVLTFMMLVEGPKWFELAAGITRDKNRARFRRLSGRMYRAVSNFVNGQVILALVAGVFSFIALEVASNVMNVSISPLALAGIVAMLGIIPLFGNPSAAAIVCSVCLLSSWKLALVMLAYFVVYFFVENHTFQPYLQSRLNELTPLTVFVAALLGIGFGGFLGAIVAIPLASAVKILLEDYFERRSGKKTAPTEDLSITTA